MNLWRTMAPKASAFAGLVCSSLGALTIFGSLERCYHAYADRGNPFADDLETLHVHLGFEIETWGVALLFLGSAFFLFRLAKKLKPAN